MLLSPPLTRKRALDTQKGVFERRFESHAHQVGKNGARRHAKERRCKIETKRAEEYRGSPQQEEETDEESPFWEKIEDEAEIETLSRLGMVTVTAPHGNSYSYQTPHSTHIDQQT
jgi:hypothetical protein